MLCTLVVYAANFSLCQVQFMVNHDSWNDVKMRPDLSVIGRGWISAHRVMRFDDVLAVGDPVFSAFKLVFRHQMNRLPRSVQNLVVVEHLVNSFSVAPAVII